MRGLLAFVCVVVFVDTVFYAAITPILPELSDEYGLSKTAAGVLAAAYPAGTLLGALPGGWLTARAGTRPTVLLGLGLLVGSSVAFAFALVNLAWATGQTAGAAGSARVATRRPDFDANVPRAPV